MCWAFQIVPSELELAYFRYTYRDLKAQVTLRIGDQSSQLAHLHQAFLLSGSLLLGGDGDDESAESKNDAIQVQSLDQLQKILKEYA